MTFPSCPFPPRKSYRLATKDPEPFQVLQKSQFSTKYAATKELASWAIANSWTPENTEIQEMICYGGFPNDQAQNRRIA